MKKFIFNFFKIILLTSCGLFFFTHMYNLRLDKIESLLVANKILINPKLSQSIIDFKLDQSRKEISILGSSRVSGFEKEMFKNQSVFNYSMIVNSIEDIYELIIELNLHKKDTIIIGLDQWNFNRNYKQRNTNSFKKNNFNTPFLLFDKILKLEDITLIGAKSIKNFSGFKNDGAYFDGKRFLVEKVDQEDYLFKDTFKRIENGDRKFEHGSKPDSIQLIYLEKILKLCKEKHIQVYGFFPPFAPSIIDKMKTYNYTYITKSTKQISKLFDKYEYHFQDFTAYNSFTDSFYLDGSHCNRNVYYQILKDLNIPININFDNEYEIAAEDKRLMINYFKNTKIIATY